MKGADLQRCSSPRLTVSFIIHDLQLPCSLQDINTLFNLFDPFLAITEDPPKRFNRVNNCLLRVILEPQKFQFEALLVM